MEVNNEMNQAVNDAQHLQELRQRINKKAEDLIGLGKSRKQHWFWLIAAILLVVVVEVINYYFWTDDFWVFNAWLGGFMITYAIMYIIMLYFLSKMKKASSAPQHYHAAKRLIKTHQLNFFFSLAVAFYFKDLVKNHGADWGAGLFASCFLIVFALIIFSAKPYWNLDKDFYDDVEELGEYK